MTFFIKILYLFFVDFTEVVALIIVPLLFSLISSCCWFNAELVVEKLFKLFEVCGGDENVLFCKFFDFCRIWYLVGFSNWIWVNGNVRRKSLKFLSIKLEITWNTWDCEDTGKDCDIFEVEMLLIKLFASLIEFISPFVLDTELVVFTSFIREWYGLRWWYELLSFCSCCSTLKKMKITVLQMES